MLVAKGMFVVIGVRYVTKLTNKNRIEIREDLRTQIRTNMKL